MASDSEEEVLFKEMRARERSISRERSRSRSVEKNTNGASKRTRSRKWLLLRIISEILVEVWLGRVISF